MYGVKRFEKEEVLELLKCGVPSAKIVSLYQIPQSTVRLWINELKSQGYDIENKNLSTQAEINNAKRTKGKIIALKVNNAEGKILSSISEYMSDTITDRQWISLTKIIKEELNKLALYFLK